MAHRLGHAHTTGYSTYLILAKISTFLPIGDIAYRVNLFSAIMASITLGCIYLSSRLVGGNKYAAILGVTALGISATVWSQSIIAEVYTTGAAFTSSVLLFVLLWYRTSKLHYLFIAGLLGGLSIGVHASVSLLAPAILIFILMNRPKGFRIWLTALGGAWIGILLTIAAFLIIDQNSAAHDIIHAGYRPAISSWDMQPEDLDTVWERFVFLYGATQWRPAMFSDPSSIMPEQAGRYFTNLPNDFSWIALTFAVIGILYTFKLDRRISALLLLGFLTHQIYTFNYSIGDIYVFYISGYLFIAIFITMGITWLFERISQFRPSWGTPLKVGLFLALVISIIFPYSQNRLDFLRNARANFSFSYSPSKEEMDLWHQDLRATIQDLEENAIVFTNWNDLYPYIYIAIVEERRDDLYFIEAKPFSPQPGLAKSTLEFILNHIDSRPIYATHELHDVEKIYLQNYLVFKGANRIFKIRR